MTNGPTIPTLPNEIRNPVHYSLVPASVVHAKADTARVESFLAGHMLSMTVGTVWWKEPGPTHRQVMSQKSTKEEAIEAKIYPDKRFASWTDNFCYANSDGTIQFLRSWAAKNRQPINRRLYITRPYRRSLMATPLGSKKAFRVATIESDGLSFESAVKPVKRHKLDEWDVVSAMIKSGFSHTQHHTPFGTLLPRSLSASMHARSVSDKLDRKIRGRMRYTSSVIGPFGPFDISGTAGYGANLHFREKLPKIPRSSVTDAVVSMTSNASAQLPEGCVLTFHLTDTQIALWTEHGAASLLCMN